MKLPTKHVGLSLYGNGLQAHRMVFLDAILLDKVYFSERLERKPLTYGRYAESTVILKEFKCIAFHYVCVLCRISIAIGHNRMHDLS